MACRDDGWLDREVEFVSHYGGCLWNSPVAQGARAHVIGKLDDYDTVGVQLANGRTMRLATSYLRRLPVKKRKAS